jgi:hypothetical protein
VHNNQLFWTQDLSISFGGLMAVDRVTLHSHLWRFLLQGGIFVGQTSSRDRP